MRPTASPVVPLSLCLAALAGCGDLASEETTDAAPLDVPTARDATPEDDGTSDRDAAMGAPRDVGVDVPVDAPRDAGSDAPPADAPPADAPTSAPDGIAPADAVPGAVALADGGVAVAVSPSMERVYRVDARADEHLGFRLDFAPAGAAIFLRVERWDGRRVEALGETDGGSGVRFLAAFDPGGPRTFFARVRSTGAVTSAGLTLTRTPFRDGTQCTSDCARLLQLPLRNDPARDGYDHAASTVFRYQFGRRDLVMFVRAAGQAMVAQGRTPFVPEDLSQWDGMTPGTDRGALRHASHQRGKDVDLSLYGSDGRAPWRSYCTARATSDGRECTPGTLSNYDARANAALFATFFATGRVTMCFLDRELIAPTSAAVPGAVTAGLVPPSVRALYSDGTHLQHWPNHDNHIHVRVSEATAGAIVYEPFEAP